MYDMANPYSIELRWHVIWTHLTTYFSIAEIAALFCVSERTVWRYIALFRQTGNIQLQQREHGPKKMLGDLDQLTYNVHVLCLFE